MRDFSLSNFIHALFESHDFCQAQPARLQENRGAKFFGCVLPSRVLLMQGWYGLYFIAWRTRQNKSDDLIHSIIFYSFFFLQFDNEPAKVKIRRVSRITLLMFRERESERVKINPSVTFSLVSFFCFVFISLEKIRCGFFSIRNCKIWRFREVIGHKIF